MGTHFIGNLLVLKRCMYKTQVVFFQFSFFCFISVNLLSKFRHVEAVEAAARQPFPSPRDESFLGCTDATLGAQDVS